MSLTMGQGPLAGSKAAPVNFAWDGAPAHRIFFEPFERRLRAIVGGVTVLDTTGAQLLHETAIGPVAYVPLDAVDPALLTRTGTTTHCPFKGDASYWTLTAGGRTITDALWAYEDPLPAAPWLEGYGAFYWDKVDEWLVEDDVVLGRLHDPYHRVDVHPSSREVVFRAGGEEIARSSHPTLVFETGLPVRAYVARTDVAPGVLTATELRTLCPYKGEARYWTVTTPGGGTFENVAWAYDMPLAESFRIQGLVSFLGEGIEVELA